MRTSGFVTGVVVVVVLSGCGSGKHTSPTRPAPPFTEAELAEFRSNIRKGLWGRSRAMTSGWLLRIGCQSTRSKQRLERECRREPKTLIGKRVLIVGYDSSTGGPCANLLPQDTITARVEYRRSVAEERFGGKAIECIELRLTRIVGSTGFARCKRRWLLALSSYRPV